MSGFQEYADILRDVVKCSKVFTPCEDNVNLIIYLDSGNWVSPIECGNPETASPDTQLKAYAKRDSNMSDRVDLGFVNPEYYTLKGRLINPVTLPDRFRPNAVYKASFEGVDGYFYSLRAPHNPFGLQDCVGSRVNGYWSSKQFQKVD